MMVVNQSVCFFCFFLFRGVVGDPAEVCMFFLFFGGRSASFVGEFFLLNEVHVEEL